MRWPVASMVSLCGGLYHNLSKMLQILQKQIVVHCLRPPSWVYLVRQKSFSDGRLLLLSRSFQNNHFWPSCACISSHTNRLSPVGNGPHKSICMSCQGLFSMVVGLRGSGAAFGAIDWHGKHDLIINSISRSITGHRTFLSPSAWYEQLLGAHFSKCLHEDIQVVRSLSHA